MKVLLSIKPEYVEAIISGTKRFEYRKSIFKQKDIDSIVVYATKPFGKVVGEFFIEEILEDDPKTIWDMTYSYAGVTKDFFLDYFKDREKGFAIKIKEFIEYEDPMDISEINSKTKTAPQSFCYIE